MERKSIIGGRRDYTRWETWQGGLAMFAPLMGCWHTSTRAELAALVMAMNAQTAIHIGIDNKTAVDKANKLIGILVEIERGERRETKKVLAKHWDLQGDGDLWRAFWDTFKEKGGWVSKNYKSQRTAAEEENS